MDTEFLITDKQLIDKLCTGEENFEFTDAEIALFEDFVESSRHLLEINQLFDSYLFNFCNLHNYYEPFFYDRIKVKNSFQSIYKTDHRIAINALTNNLVSSAITLINAIEVFLEELSEKKRLAPIEEVKKNWTGTVYDSSFEYRFFYLLRNFMQHNHLSVSIETGNENEFYCCFDLSQILNTPHFNMKPAIKEELSKLASKMQQAHFGHSRLAYTVTIAKFHINVLELHRQYLIIIDSVIKEICDACNEYFSSNQSVIRKSDDEFNGFVLYRTGDMLHAFKPVPSFYFYEFLQLKQRSQEIYINEIEELKDIKFIPLQE